MLREVSLRIFPVSIVVLVCLACCAFPVMRNFLFYYDSFIKAMGPMCVRSVSVKSVGTAARNLVSKHENFAGLRYAYTPLALDHSGPADGLTLGTLRQMWWVVVAIRIPA